MKKKILIGLMLFGMASTLHADFTLYDLFVSGGIKTDKS